MRFILKSAGRMGLPLLVAAALALSGCGRRGPLELPPGSAPAQKQAASTTSSLSPGAPKATDGPTVKPPDTPFILDPLL